MKWLKFQHLKNQVALLFLVLSLLDTIFPNLAKGGLFSSASNAQIGILIVIMISTALILFFIPEAK